MTSHLCRFVHSSFPRSCIIMGNLRAGFPSEDLRLDFQQVHCAHLSLKLPKMLLWKFGPLKWLAFVDIDMGPPTSIGESDLDGVGLAVECWSLFRMAESEFSEKRLERRSSNLAPGDGVPSLLLEHDCWLMLLLDSGRSFSDSTLGLDGATLSLLPSSSSRSASPVTFGDDESRLSPSCCVAVLR